MTHNTKPISPLRQRMLDDMALRKLSEKTQNKYIRAVVNFTRFLGRSPDTATAEDLRRYQLHLVDSGMSNIMLNATITALRFFFAVTLDRADAMAKMSPVREPRKLPVVLSREEAARLIEAAGLKGERIGGAQISTRHANFIVNTGGATASDVIALIAKARALVRLGVGNQDLLAQVTNRSVARLTLKEGDRVFAQVKSVTVRH